VGRNGVDPGVLLKVKTLNILYKGKEMRRECPIVVDIEPNRTDLHQCFGWRSLNYFESDSDGLLFLVG
jgi:hypothetical protein